MDSGGFGKFTTTNEGQVQYCAVYSYNALIVSSDFKAAKVLSESRSFGKERSLHFAFAKCHIVYMIYISAAVHRCFTFL